MEQQVQDIEIRLRLLEQLHVWGSVAIAAVLLGIILYKNKEK